MPNNRPKLLQTADIPEIMRILSQVYHQDYPFPVGGGWSALQIGQELDRGSGLGIFGENYVLRAFVIFTRVDSNFEISILATDKVERRQGLMLILLNYLKTYWADNKEIWLEVHEGNAAARKLYEKQGFTKEGQRPSYYRDGASAILYTLR